MVIFTTKIPKKKFLAVLIFLLAVALIALLLRPKAAETAPRAGNNAERIAYLTSFGWEVSAEPLETLAVTLGETLEEPYLSYNELQKSQGFDLTEYCGKSLTRYTYAVANYPGRADAQADLYLCGDVIVAGDIVCLGENGFMAGLAFPAADVQAG